MLRGISRKTLLLAGLGEKVKSISYAIGVAHQCILLIRLVVVISKVNESKQL